MTATNQREELQRLWGGGGLRVFISHTGEKKRLAKDVQENLRAFGMASFVAHEDIKPLKEWREEIEKALKSMDLLLALLTEDFRKSKWTDQEVGVAIGREVRVMPVRMGEDPYGFMDRYQAIPGNLGGRGIAAEVLALALDMDEVRDEAIDTFILAVARSENYGRSDPLAECLPKISHLTAKQEAKLVRAFSDNDQVNTQNPWTDIIVGHLKRSQ